MRPRPCQRDRWASLMGILTLTSIHLGCSEIRLKTVDSHERVISTHQRLEPAASVDTRARLDGTVLLLEAVQSCQLVAVHEVEVIEERAADEDLIEEFILLGVAGIPLVSGIVVLADAPHVHDDDRNARLYNPIGKNGAYAAGTVLTTVGGLVALVPIIELLRIASAGETTQEVVTRRGDVLDPDRPCDGRPRPVRASVVLRVGGVSLSTPGTDQDGLLRLDLAEAIPPDMARRAVVVQVVLGGEVVAEIDPRPIVEAQQARAAQIATEPPEQPPEPPEPTEGGGPEPKPPEPTEGGGPEPTGPHDDEPTEGGTPTDDEPTDDDEPTEGGTPEPPAGEPPDRRLPATQGTKAQRRSRSKAEACRHACRMACHRQNDDPRPERVKAVVACSNRCIEERCE